MRHLENLYLDEHLQAIEALVGQHISARTVIAASRNGLGNRLAISVRGKSGMVDEIRLVRAISIAEQMSVIMEIMQKARATGLEPLEKLAERLMSAPSTALLEFLVLHEVAHLKNGWNSTREMDCNLWAARRMLEKPAAAHMEPAPEAGSN